ncbi:hypothetical protein JOB18_030868 [Solea senegalensis]|uniref:Uncharacterized protein n=1 Tax=Solea senegalensis TaxID=28829 RepID=A0AAV6T0G2_SOLSE|nr:hypothetical protein JOB18_030868 [Solea senegalensis]
MFILTQIACPTPVIAPSSFNKLQLTFKRTLFKMSSKIYQQIHPKPNEFHYNLQRFLLYLYFEKTKTSHPPTFSLPVHRNMPKDQAMDFVTAEYSRGLLKERTPRDPADIAAQTSQLLDDFLDREKVERHSIPSETRQLLTLLAEGVHLYPEELETISEYVRSRQEYIHASNTEGERGSLLLTSGQGKPPPLLPTPPGPPLCDLEEGPLMDHNLPTRPPLLPSPGFYPKSKPPSLLSLNQLPCPPLAGPSFQGSFNGPPLLRGPPLLPHSPLYHSGSRGSPGMRGAPPLLKSSRPPLLLSPGPPPLRPSGPRH